MFDLSQKFLYQHLNQAICPSTGVRYTLLFTFHYSHHSFVCDARTTQAMLTFFSLQSPEPDLSQSHQNVGHCPIRAL